MTEDLPTPDSDFNDPHLRPRPLNFSRPRLATYSSGQQAIVRHDRSDAVVHDLSAFRVPTDPPPPARLSMDSDATTTTDSSDTTNSAGYHFAWDGQTGELRSRQPPVHSLSHHSSQPSATPATRTITSSSAMSGTTPPSSSQPFPAELPSSTPPPPIPQKFPRILKRTSVEQQSERMSISSTSQSQGWEDSASHHTVSVDGEAGHAHSEGQWRSSDFDTSGLSVAEIHKLRKKGINPALYAEMKAARKGKGKWVGPLSGNSCIA